MGLRAARRARFGRARLRQRRPNKVNKTQTGTSAGLVGCARMRLYYAAWLQFEYKLIYVLRYMLTYRFDRHVGPGRLSEVAYCTSILVPTRWGRKSK